MKMMNLVFKIMDFVSQIMDFALKRWIFPSGEALIASVFVGFPHADIANAGLSAVVSGHRNLLTTVQSL